MNLFIEGSRISAQVLYFLWALFGATRIHSYTRMASLIRTPQSDLFATSMELLGWKINTSSTFSEVTHA